MRKTKTKKDRKLEALESQLLNNVMAIQEGPKKRKWSIHDLREIKPITESQRLMMEAYYQGNHVVASGSPGTGKSFLALYLALNDILTRESGRNRIILVRSVVPSRDIGHLPGTLEEKTEVYELPYKDIMHELMGKSTAYDHMKDANVIEFLCSSYVRGLTWDNAIVIMDESQNMNPMEFHSVVTRLGENSKLIVCGDIGQNDLIYKRNEYSGFAEALDVFKKMDTVDIINFSENDIVRSGFVKAWIIAKQSL